MPTTSTGGGRDDPTVAPLQRVANRPIVCHVLEQMQQAGIDQVALMAPSWGLDALRAGVAADGPSGLDVVYAPYERDGDFEDALRAVADLIGEQPCFVHAADGMLMQPLAELIHSRKEDGEPDLVAFVHRSADGSTALATRRLLRLLEEAPSPISIERVPEGGSLELAGVCLFGPGALHRAGTARWWQGGRLDLATITERFVQTGARLSIEPTEGWLQYGGSTVELLELNHFLLDSLPREAPCMNGGANRIEGCVVVHPTASVQSSTIVGPVIIGPGALVADSYIGPYTSIGADAHVEGAEVERSIILSGAKITHIGGRLVGSVVGRDARIFRDFSLPRAMRLNVGDGGEVALC